MKQLLFALFASVMALTVSAQPILVGHRGSGYGVESTEEAFRRGAALGYKYVESDIKVTSDKRFVLSHDDDLTRLGGTYTVASSTLEQLQSETLTQTRNGVSYTGRLLSLEEWLALCDELKLLPLIELKWATGVNSNDCSNIPLLIKTIEDCGYRDRCIILTSMKPCLEYIRKNYPDIELQFLTGQYWANHFDWCVEQGIDVDIQAGYFDETTVAKFHKEGLKVNMWTTNDAAGYRKYAGWGCDFITTDRLDGNDLPVVLPPEEHPEPGPVELVFETKWVRSTVDGNAPEHIHGTNAQQGTAVDGLFYVNDCVDKLIYIFRDGECLGSIPGGAGYGCCRDFAGNIIVRDDKLTGEDHTFIIYPAGVMPERYGTPVRLEVKVPVTGQTNFINAAGDVLGLGGRIYLYPKNMAQVNIIEVAGGQLVEVKASNQLEIQGSAAGYVVPTENSDVKWYYQVRNKGIYYYRGQVSEDFAVGGASTTAPARNSTGGAAFFTINDNRIYVHNSGANYKGGFTVRNQSLGTVIATVAPIGTLGYEEGGNYSTFNWLIAEETSPQDFTIYQYCPANGMGVYRLYNRLNSVADIKTDADVSVSVVGTTVTVSGVVATTPVAVYSLTGTKVATGSADATDVASLSKGVYVVRVAGAAFKVLL